MDINARGYVSNGETKVSKAGVSYNKFTVGVKQKEKAYGDRPERVTWANLNVTDMSGGALPPPGSYVTIDGRLNVREYEHNGVKRQALEVFTKAVSVAPPLDSTSSPGLDTQKAGTKQADPWD